uniref:Uncharacterized protein n=1 Tax=Picea glauca TaxID=3330 RepID=A0A101M0I2_PICGL|nr:hypothetical protein ABT39_MTgene4117 [Picea glauca]QHR92565.1 hypothetical protein Q903MT_gene6611 [Picea sitchensis]
MSNSTRDMKCYTRPLSSLIATFDHIAYFIQFFLLTHIINKLFHLMDLLPSSSLVRCFRIFSTILD